MYRDANGVSLRRQRLTIFALVENIVTHTHTRLNDLSPWRRGGDRGKATTAKDGGGGGGGGGGSSNDDGDGGGSLWGCSR